MLSVTGVQPCPELAAIASRGASALWQAEIAVYERDLNRIIRLQPIYANPPPLAPRQYARAAPPAEVPPPPIGGGQAKPLQRTSAPGNTPRLPSPAERNQQLAGASDCATPEDLDLLYCAALIQTSSCTITEVVWVWPPTFRRTV